MSISKEWLEFLREQFPVGSRIEVKQSAANRPDLDNCKTGELRAISDDAGFFVRLDNGKSVMLDIGFDRFSVKEPEAHTMKLYMPLTGDAFEPNEYGDMDWEPMPLDAHDLIQYENEIMAALVRYREPEEAERGIMEYYREDDSVNHKVRSVVFTAEEREDKLWGVAECRIAGELTPDELETLKEYVTGQASDGWGEGFEQREIKYGDGCQMNVHLWNSDSWSLQTEDECFNPKQGLPDMCWSTLGTTGELICIKRGENGYYPSDWNTDDRQRNREIADAANEQRGVTKNQEQAMVCGSMFGWGVPGADPKFYEQHAPQMGGMTLG